MARGRKKNDSPAEPNGNGANLGFEAKLWLAADKLRSNMDAAEHEHIVLGPIRSKDITHRLDTESQHRFA